MPALYVPVRGSKWGCSKNTGAARGRMRLFWHFGSYIVWLAPASRGVLIPRRDPFLFLTLHTTMAGMCPPLILHFHCPYIFRESTVDDKNSSIEFRRHRLFEKTLDPHWVLNVRFFFPFFLDCHWPNQSIWEKDRWCPDTNFLFFLTAIGPIHLFEKKINGAQTQILGLVLCPFYFGCIRDNTWHNMLPLMSILFWVYNAQDMA